MAETQDQRAERIALHHVQALVGVPFARAKAQRVGTDGIHPVVRVTITVNVTVQADTDASRIGNPRG